MNSFSLKISTPEGDLFCGEATKLCVRGTEGELAVMAGHIPFVTAIKPCDCKVELPEGDVRMGRADGGLLTVSGKGAVLLTGGFTWKDE